MRLVYIGKTEDDIYSRIVLARIINEQCGGAVVSPWEVDELPDVMVDAFTELQKVMDERQKPKRRKR